MIGTAWLVIKESVYGNKVHLLSVLNPRKLSKDITWYLEQIFVERFASFDEKILYKKDSKKSAFRIEPHEITSTIISCGHDPIYLAYRCHWLKRVENYLLFSYLRSRSWSF